MKYFSEKNEYSGQGKPEEMENKEDKDESKRRSKIYLQTGQD